MSFSSSHIDHKRADSIWKHVIEEHEASFKEFFQLFHDPLIEYGMQIQSDISLVSDVVQELFIIMWQKKDTINLQSTISQYMFRAFRNNLLREIQKENKRKSHQSTFQQQLSSDKNEIKSNIKLNQSLAELPLRQREIIYLKYQLNLPYSDIISIMEISKESCYKLMNKAITSLRKQMSGKEKT